MKELMDACNQLKDAVSAIDKAMTKYSGEKIDGYQDGNVGNTVNGEEEYSKFDNAAKKNLLKQKMMVEG